jgi:hypothetical protein
VQVTCINVLNILEFNYSVLRIETGTLNKGLFKMIETILQDSSSLPFMYNQNGSVLVSDNPIILDLFFLEEFNGLILKNFNCFDVLPSRMYRETVEIKSKEGLKELDSYGFNDEFKHIIFEFLEGLNTTVIGVEVSEPKKEMCPSIHVDKLPLRIVQCLDSIGTVLYLSDGTTIEAQKGDLIFMKGEMWKSTPGALKHRSPASSELRTLLRIDFLN